MRCRRSRGSFRNAMYSSTCLNCRKGKQNMENEEERAETFGFMNSLAALQFANSFDLGHPYCLRVDWCVVSSKYSSSFVRTCNYLLFTFELKRRKSIRVMYCLCYRGETKICVLRQHFMTDLFVAKTWKSWVGQFLFHEPHEKLLKTYEWKQEICANVQGNSLVNY